MSSLNDSPEAIGNKFRREKIGTYLVKGIEAFSETGRLSELEKISDNYLMELNKDSRYIGYSTKDSNCLSTAVSRCWRESGSRCRGKVCLSEPICAAFP